MTLTHGECDEDTVTVTKGESTDLFVAKDETTGVASQGKTKSEALAMLAEGSNCVRVSVSRSRARKEFMR